MRLSFEIEGVPGEQELPGGGRALVAFMSFAVSRGFGATHPLIALADRLHAEHGVSMGPLTTFYDADIEDSEDVDKLERAWQEPFPLQRSLRTMAAALEADDQARALARRANADTLGVDASALAEAIEPAVATGARVRLEYRL